jgi:serine O-acetyltransferase
LFETLKEDIKTVFAKDPAARSVPEVVLCYPGLHAIWFHRLAHYLWRHGFRFLARLVSHLSRFLTGIEIRPGARIGRRFFIDHGAGVVIGETAKIGDDVLMYQGVVLGGTSLHKGKRHPTIGNKVVMGTGSVALGDITIGEGARIGSGSVVVKRVPPGATVVGIPGRVAEDGHSPFTALEHGKLPDPVAEAIGLVLGKQELFEQRLRKLENTDNAALVEDEFEKIKARVMNNFSDGGGI